jgi:hypothetical protein
MPYSCHTYINCFLALLLIRRILFASDSLCVSCWKYTKSNKMHFKTHNVKENRLKGVTQWGKQTPCWSNVKVKCKIKTFLIGMHGIAGGWRKIETKSELSDKFLYTDCNFQCFYIHGLFASLSFISTYSVSMLPRERMKWRNWLHHLMFVLFFLFIAHSLVFTAQRHYYYFIASFTHIQQKAVQLPTGVHSCLLAIKSSHTNLFSLRLLDLTPRRMLWTL